MISNQNIRNPKILERISNMNFFEFFISVIIGVFMGVLFMAFILEDKVITIKELNEHGYDYNKYSKVINGVETNWVEIIKR